jgi:hypothetical protein
MSLSRLTSLSFIYSQQQSAPPSSESANGDSDIKKGSVLECVGRISNKLNIVVSSVTSVTHERMSLKTNEQYRKAIKSVSLLSCLSSHYSFPL